MTDVSRKLNGSEIRNAYRLFLGREAESDKVVQEIIDAADDGWLGGFIHSDEFKNGTAQAIRGRTILKQQTVALTPPAELVIWVAKDVPLKPESRERARNTKSWSDLLLIVLSDDVFRAVALKKWDLGSYVDELTLALQLYNKHPVKNIVGDVDRISQDHLEGWIVDADDPSREMTVELWVDGQFLAAAKATLIRRNLQERFNSQGRHGFILRYNQPGEKLSREACLIEPASGLTLAQFQLPVFKEPPLDLLASMRAELLEVRRLLSRIESLLPEYQDHLSYRLASYSEYFNAYYRHRAVVPISGSPVNLALIVIGMGASTLELTWTLASIAKQRDRPAKVIVVHGSRDRKLEEEAVISRAGDAMGGATPVEARFCDGDDWSAPLSMIFDEIEEPDVLLLRCQGMLAFDAVGVFSQALRNGASLAYADEDRVDLSADGHQVHHREPILRTEFDMDLLRQVDFLGDVFAIKREIASKLGFHEYPGSTTLFDLLLRIGAQDAADIVHLPRILFHRAQRPNLPPIETRLAIVQKHLQREDHDAQIEVHHDTLGAQVEGALRVRYPIPHGTKAAIIIPTRDRLDLLGPCLAAISNAIAASRTALEVIVVDNGSELATTRAVLSAFEQSGVLRLIKYDGPFNWALMNNLASEATDADVLIFLNNDTVAVDRTCWDELVMQALRPGVGAVGARMLYEDGTLQHAGLVIGNGHGFAEHEGMGDPGGDPGYMGRYSLLRQVSAVTGACLATRAHLFRQVGKFDETLPVEGNDVDYCLKLRAAGLVILYDPYATLYHFESKSRGYNETEEKRRSAALVTERLRERWSDRFGRDPFYNDHFDQFAPVMTKLKPPPVL